MDSKSNTSNKNNIRSALDRLQSYNAALLHIPDDISILGFDDIPQSALVYTKVTTVRQPLEDKSQSSCYWSEAEIQTVRYIGLRWRHNLPFVTFQISSDKHRKILKRQEAAYIK